MKLTVHVEPLPMCRPRFSKFGGVYYPKEIIEYKKRISEVAKSVMKEQQLEPMTGELSAVVQLYRKFTRTSRRYGDCDNHLKAIFDALNGVCFVDDSQIVTCSCQKFTDREQPRIEIELLECNCDE